MKHERRKPGRARHRPKAYGGAGGVACARPCIIQIRAGCLRQRRGSAAHRSPPRESKEDPPGVSRARPAAYLQAKGPGTHRLQGARPALFLFL